MSSFTKPFKVKVHNQQLKDKPFEVADSFYYYPDIYPNIIINIPVGYRTDFASIPRVFWSILPPVGRYSKAAVVHDYLIDETDIDIKKINKIFLEAMEVLGVNIVTRHIIYASVQFYSKFGKYISNGVRKLINKELK